MDTVKLIIQGYARHNPDGRWDATSATVLVQSAGKIVLIDPGVNLALLTDALQKENLTLDSVDLVTVTHSHYDHSRSTRLFNKSKIYTIALSLKQLASAENPIYIPDTEIRVLHTPGHVDKHVSFLVNIASGKYAIAGDVFQWEDGQEQKTDLQSLVGHIDPIAKNTNVLHKSRLKLLDNADIIIPGHGKIFVVPGQLSYCSHGEFLNEYHSTKKDLSAFLPSYTIINKAYER